MFDDRNIPYDRYLNVQKEIFNLTEHPASDIKKSKEHFLIVKNKTVDFI